MANGKLRYSLKKPWRDGTVALVLEPLDRLARVCALIPPPRFHMVRYHGVLSSHAKARSEVVPKVGTTAVQLPLFMEDKTACGAGAVLAPEPRRKPWAWLLRHVFDIDVSICPRCGGATRWLEAATKPQAIARLLAKHGLGPRPPPNPLPKGQLRLAFPLGMSRPDHARHLLRRRPGRSSIRRPRSGPSAGPGPPADSTTTLLAAAFDPEAHAPNAPALRFR